MKMLQVHKNTLLEHGVQLDTKTQGSVLALLLKETFALGLFLSLSVSPTLGLQSLLMPLSFAGSWVKMCVSI